MKVLSALLGVSVLQSADGAVVSFNKAMAKSGGQQQQQQTGRMMAFAATNSEPMPHSLMLKAAGYDEPRIACSGGDHNDTPDEYEGEATILLAISQCLSDGAYDTVQSWVSTLHADELSIYDSGKQRKIKFVTHVIPGVCPEPEGNGAALTDYGNAYAVENKDVQGNKEHHDSDVKEHHDEGGDEEHKDDDKPDGDKEQKPEGDKEHQNGGDKEQHEEGDKEKHDEGDKEHKADGDKDDTKPAEGYDDKTHDEHADSAEPTPSVTIAKRMLRGANAQDRFDAYSQYGPVETGLPEYADGAYPSDGPIGIISFCDTQEAYDAVTKYASGAHIQNAYHFQLCDQYADGCSSTNTYAKAVPLYNNVDLYMYNPFTISRGLQCAALADGVPVSYVDTYGKRQCFCTCPAGYELASVVSDDGTVNYKTCNQVTTDVCPCTWSTHGGYTHEVTTDLDGVCLFQNISSGWSVPAPFPNDNYVADDRANDHDLSTDLNSGPHIEVSTTRESPPVYNYASVSKYLQEASTDYATTHIMPDNLPDYVSSIDYRRVVSSVAQYETTDSQSNQHTWIDYEQNRQQVIDSLKFSSYGKYDLKLVANDYSSTAECNGCLAIVDKFRPKATTVCPSNFSASTYGGEIIPVAAKDTLEKANTLLYEYFEFQAKATNDGCSNDNRCDAESFRLKDFFQSDYSSMDNYNDGKACFDPFKICDAFLTSTTASTNPLLTTDSYGAVAPSQDDKPVVDGQCTRCCDLSTSLRERWVDYTCGSNYDFERCEGDASETCSFSQCLELKPEVIAAASSCIKPDIQRESQKVLSELSAEGFQTATQIHRALECSKFGGDDGVCSFETTIDALIDHHVEAKIDTGNYIDINKFVFWRYRLSTDHKWRVFGGDSYAETLKFTKPDTEITVEAWTQCGQLYTACFHVLLHVQSAVQVCDHFNEMWYQTSVPKKDAPESSSDLCQYPKSDFAELTFDFHPETGIHHEHGKSLHTSVSNVVCHLAYTSRSNVTIVNVTKDAPEIVSRYAVKLVDLVATAPETHFTVTCDFVYARYGSPSLTQTCAKAFTIKDCTPPEIDSETEQCLYNDCAGDGKPGPFEACGGQIVSASANESLFSTGEVSCCQACTGLATTQCEFVLDTPDETNSIKRCEPHFTNPSYGYGGVVPTEEYSTYSSTVTQLMSTGTNLISVGENHAKTTAALAASAVIGVVALVVVQRRRRAAAQAPQSTFMEDAYYPLLH